jgi:hypothetical protein
LGQEGAWSKRRQLQAYALIGTNKAEFIVLRQMRKINWDKADLRFIYEIKRLSHDNLTTFMGICYNDGDRWVHKLLIACVDDCQQRDFLNR